MIITTLTIAYLQSSPFSSMFCVSIVYVYHIIDLQKGVEFLGLPLLCSSGEDV